MFITFYDNQFRALQNNASLNVGTYTIRRRAVDFDDFTCISEPFIEDVNPTFVVFSDDRGRYVYSAFAGIPTLDKNNQTSLQASDLKTIFNNDIVSSFGTFTYLKDYFLQVLSEFITQVNPGFSIEFEQSRIQDVLMTDLLPPSEMKVYNIWEELIVPYLKYYDCYMESKIDKANKKVVFTIGKINARTVSLRLWEFGIKNFGKAIVSVNETTGVVKLNDGLHYTSSYILRSDNTITTNSENRDLFPVKKKVYFKEIDDVNKLSETLAEARVEALKALVEARYLERLEINPNNIKSFEEASFSTQFALYTEKGKFYKNLPLGEIIESDKGEKKLVIGYKPNNIEFYLGGKR